jgi:hypothetical protein
MNINKSNKRDKQRLKRKQWKPTSGRSVFLTLNIQIEKGIIARKESGK